jgi:DNA-binding MarR family transcriptional regulator
MDDVLVGRVRSFNRTVTQRVGALSDRYLARERPLGEARVLWEIGTEGCEVRSLRSRLGLDSGHASRLLRALEEAGMVRVEPSPLDRRIRIAQLTGPAAPSARCSIGAATSWPRRCSTRSTLASARRS